MRPVNIINDLLTPIGAFIRLKEFNPVFLFESVERTGNAGRYSFIGMDPLNTISYKIGENDGDFVNKMRKAMDKLGSSPEWERRIPAGLVGLTSFEMIHEFAGIGKGLNRSSSLPDALFVVPGILLLFDHVNHSLSIFQTDREEPDKTLMDEIMAALRNAPLGIESSPAHSGGVMNMTQPELVERIVTMKEHIRNGEIYQAIMSAKFTGETQQNPFQIYRALRHLMPSPYLYYMELGGVHVLGSSPETMVRLEKDEMKLTPLSGLRTRVDKRAEDAQIARELLSDKIELAKHNLLLDQAIGDVGKVCETDSIHVPVRVEEELYSQEVNLMSSIKGHKRADMDAFDVFKAAFPAGTVTGAPKPRAAEIINQLEGGPRGAYGGAVGYFSKNGTMDQAIAVRSIIIKDQQFTTQAGVCITAASDPEKDAVTIIEKGNNMLRALDVARECL